MTNAKKVWKKEEELYLEENWGTISIPTIAKNLGRSVDAIKVRASRLGLGPCLLGGEYVSFNQLVIALTGHISHSYHLISWVENRGFPIHTKRVNKNTFRVVYLDEFWEWSEKNKSFIDFSKMEPFALGEEPDWVAEQRHKDYNAFYLQRKTPWTPEEDSQLLYLLKKQQYSYTEISERLHRSVGAIQL